MKTLLIFLISIPILLTIYLLTDHSYQDGSVTLKDAVELRSDKFEILEWSYKNEKITIEHYDIIYNCGGEFEIKGKYEEGVIYLKEIIEIGSSALCNYSVRFKIVIEDEIKFPTKLVIKKIHNGEEIDFQEFFIGKKFGSKKIKIY